MAVVKEGQLRAVVPQVVRVMEMEQVLEAQAVAVPAVMHSRPTSDVIPVTQVKQTTKMPLRWRFAAVFILLLVFTPTLAALLWTYLQRRY